MRDVSGGWDPWSDLQGHARIVVTRNEEAGLTAVIAIHSTVLGPALGGVRMATFADAPDPRVAAYRDALRLSRAMTYKNSLAGLDHGGGKGVIVGDPHTKTTAQLHAFGEFVSSLRGDYVTAGDVGMTVTDMDTIGETCIWTTGRSPERGGVGDSGILTAIGVWQGMRASAAAVFGSAELADRHVGVVGAGKVGGRLIGHLVEEGARVTFVDPLPGVRAQILDAYPGVRVADTVADLLATDIDVLSPNALGGLLTLDLAAGVGARLICGGANNQLATPEVGPLLAARGITYAPDFMVNCGGVIQVAEELRGADVERARSQVMRVFETTSRVLGRAAHEGITPVAAAEAEAEARIAQAHLSGSQPNR